VAKSDRVFPRTLRKLLKRQARLTGLIAAHPALQTEANRKTVEFFELVMKMTCEKALENFDDAEADFVWPETLDEAA